MYEIDEPSTPGPPKDTSDAPGLVCIVGMGRSGSTYLERRLAELHGGLAVGELVGVWGAFGTEGSFCSCGALASECPFWALVSKKYPGIIDSQTIDFMRKTNNSIMPVRNFVQWRSLVKHGTYDRFANYQFEVDKLYRAISLAADACGYNFVVDSSKHPAFYYLASTSGAFRNFRTVNPIRLVRDPRAVVYSLSKPKLDKLSQGEQAKMRRYGALRGVGYWWAMNTAADKVVPRSTPLLKYEDFESGAYNRVMVGLGYDPISVPSQVSRHQLAGNPDRGFAIVSFSADHRWESMPSFSKIMVKTAMLPLMKRYGYLSP